MAETPLTDTLAGKLTDQMDSLQEAFLTLSRAGTLQDLAGQFSALLRQFYPGTSVDLYHRAADGPGWSHLAGNSVQELGLAIPFPAGGAAASCALSDGVPGVRIVQRLVDHSCVCLLLQDHGRKTAYGESEILSLRLFFHLFDTAYQSLLHRKSEKDLLFSLNNRVLQLTSLIDTGIELAKLVDGSAACQLALERAASLANAARGLVTLLASDKIINTIAFPAGASKERRTDTRFRLSSGFTFNGTQYTFELFDKESRRGTEAFEETDALLLDAIVRQVQASLENDYLHQQALEKEKIEHDLALAASIQQQILPRSLPRIDGYDIAGMNIPTKLVGGDYYDCIPLSEGKYALVVADVSGKGMPAALLVSSLHAYLSAYLETPTTPVQLARRLNQVIYRATTDDRFITAFIAFFDPQTGEIESVNAGHNPAYLLSSNKDVRELGTGGLALGMLDIDFPWESESVTIGKGERLLLYTDGVTEAANEERVLYDTVLPLKEFFAANTPDRAETFVADLIGDIKKFTGNAPQNDDITALYLLRH